MREPRLRALALAAVITLGAPLAACDRLEGAVGSAKPTTGWPAAAAGVLCELLDYDQVAKELGTRFDRAGGVHQADVYTCALTQRGRPYPDITLAMAATTADDLIFGVSVAPPGSVVVKELGIAAYRSVTPPGPDHGPAIELGWLARKGRIMILRYEFAAGATDSDVNAMAPRLLTLAQRVDRTLG